MNAKQDVSKHLDAYDKIMIFDLETTGLNPCTDQIIAFAAVVLTVKDQQLIELESIHHVVKSPTKNLEKVVAQSGITEPKASEQGIEPWELAGLIAPYVNNHTLLVAYNLHKDIGFLYALLKRYKGFKDIDNDVLDLLTVYKDHHDDPHQLEDVLKAYNIQRTNAHRALDDTSAIASLFKQMHAMYDIECYINVISYVQHYGLNGYILLHVNYLPQPAHIQTMCQSLKSAE